MLKEFRDFIAKGNMLDLAVGIVIGVAFTAIVNSFVKDLVTPLIGVFGKANFDSWFVVLKDGSHTVQPGPYASLDAAVKDGAVTMNYGSFLSALINFLIVALSVFIMIKTFEKLQSLRAAEEPEPEPLTRSEELLTEIRDALVTQEQP